MSSVPPVHTGQCQVSHLSTLYNTKCPTGHTGQCQVSHLSTLYNTKCPTGHTGQCQVSHLSTLYNTKCPTGHTGQCQAFYLTTLNKGLVSHLSTQDNIVHFLGGCPICQNQAMSSVPPGHILQRQVSTLNEVKAPSCARSHSQSLAAAASDHVQWPSVTSQQLELLTTVGRFPPDNYQSSWRINSFTLTINTPSPSPPPKKKKKKKNNSFARTNNDSRERISDTPLTINSCALTTTFPPHPTPHPDSQRCSPDSYCSDLPLKEGTSWVCQIAVNILEIRNKVIWNVNFPSFCYLSSHTGVQKLEFAGISCIVSQHVLVLTRASPVTLRHDTGWQTHPGSPMQQHRLAYAPWFTCAAAPVGRCTLVYLCCNIGWHTPW